MPLSPKGKAAHLYISPGGSTRKAGQFVCSLLEDEGYEILDFDLARCRGREGELREGMEQADLLLVGSPVYAGHILRPLRQFLGSAPHGKGKPALAYVCYGAVSRGGSLFHLARALDNLGYRVLGLAEVIGEHSMMFRAGEPLGRGRPDDGDREVLRAWMERIKPRLNQRGGGSMDYSVVCPPGPAGRILDATFFTPGFMHLLWPPMRFRGDRCIDCGACKKACPVGRLDRLPTIDREIKCLYCYSCVRKCSQGAFDAPMWTTHSAIRLFNRVLGRRERQSTRFYA
jgi:NAD-dependent dihydropyrimidine dehydrogenase PreA subunit